jgi:hypothetical protein
MKAENIINIVLVASIIGGLFFLIYNLRHEPIEHITIERDTVHHVDTIRVPKFIYIQKMHAKIDTLFIDSSNVLVAHADTTIQKDSSKIKVSYYFPPQNYFEIMLDLKEKIIHELKTITEIKTITISEPWYKNTWFYSTVLSILVLFMVI